MGTYIISLLSAALAIAIIGNLTPEGGISKHIRLLSSLFLICVLIAPASKMIEALRAIANGSFELDRFEESSESDIRDQMQAGLDESSKKYFLDSLTQMLEVEFSIEQGDIRCKATWAERDKEIVPERITVLLSGSAIWKDPIKIETFVTELLGCECITAIE